MAKGSRLSMLPATVGLASLGLGGCFSSGGVTSLPQALPGPTATPFAKICAPNATIDCSQLGAIWKSGSTAVCEDDGTAYRVTACVRTGDADKRVSEVIHPAERDPRWANARCSYQGNYDFQISVPPHPDGTWVINVQGGGFCAFDGSGPGGCSNRDANLVKSAAVADRTLKNDAEIVDPDFSNSVWVYTHYCSNDQYAGTNAIGTSIHYPGDSGPLSKFVFTGRYNFQAMLEILRERYGMNDATKDLQIYAIGHSAGGWGVTNNAFAMKAIFPRAAATGNLLLATHSGFVPFGWSDPNYPAFGIPGLTMAGAFKSLRTTWGAASAPVCLADHPTDPETCLSGSVMFDYITGPESNGKGMDLPLLVFQNRQDQLYMGLASLPPDAAALGAADRDARNRFIGMMNAAMGVDPATPNESTRVPWLFTPSDPDVVTASGVEPNVHPPLEYQANPPDGAANSLDSVTSRFWRARGKGPGRGRSPGEVHTYECNWVPNHLCP